MASLSSHPSAKCRHATAPPSLCSLTDDLLAEIFLLLPTLADVGRATTACAAFRRVIADHAFLRRLRRAHPAPLLGLLSKSSFHQAEPPHRSAPAARALAQAADFSFSFVPSAATILCRRIPIDARDGRVLLSLDRDHREFAVCDPLSRRYLVLPKVPHEDPASSGSGRPPHARYCAAFLVPVAGAGESETSFKVVWMEEWSPEPLIAFVFSSATAQWSRLATGNNHRGGMPRLYRVHHATPSYAYGCFYWIFTSDVKLFPNVSNSEDKLLVLDTRSMEFSTVDLPPGPGSGFWDYAIVEAGEARIGMLTLHKSSFISSWPSYIGYAILGVDNDGTCKWQSERTVLTLPSQRSYSIVGATDRCLLLHGYPNFSRLESSSWGKSNIRETSDVDLAFFSVELESMQIQKVCRSLSGLAKPYTGFPPSLSIPSV